MMLQFFPSVTSFVYIHVMLSEFFCISITLSIPRSVPTTIIELESRIFCVTDLSRLQ